MYVLFATMTLTRFFLCYIIFVYKGSSLEALMDKENFPGEFRGRMFTADPGREVF